MCGIKQGNFIQCYTLETFLLLGLLSNSKITIAIFIVTCFHKLLVKSCFLCIALQKMKMLKGSITLLTYLLLLHMMLKINSKIATIKPTATSKPIKVTSNVVRDMCLKK